MQALEPATQAVGWELADLIEKDKKEADHAEG
jgi:hypothetical protein